MELRLKSYNNGCFLQDCHISLHGGGRGNQSFRCVMTILGCQFDLYLELTKTQAT